MNASKSFLVALAAIAFTMTKPAQGARLEQWLPLKYSEGLVACPKISPERKVGFVDKNGKDVIDARFDAARPFNQGVAAVRVKGKWGYIDHAGAFVIAPEFDAVGVLDYPGDDPMDFSEDLAAVRSDGMVGFIGKTGKFVVPPKFSSAWEFKDGLAAAQDRFSGKWGFIDKSGKWSIKPTFADARSFSEGLAPVSTTAAAGKPGWGFIDRSGKFVVEPQYSLALGHHEGLALVLKLVNGVYQGKYIDKKGVAAFNDVNCHGGKYFVEGLAPINLKDYKVGFIDRAGKTLIDAKFQEARPFNDGFAVVRIDDINWGLIDKTGKLQFQKSVK